MNAHDAKKEIERFLQTSGGEWLLVNHSGRNFALQAGEMEITVEREKLFFGFLRDEGFQTWRVADYKFEDEKIRFELTRNFQKERAKVELVPRVSASALSATVEQARLKKAQEIAGLIIQSNPPTKLVRAELNRETGRFAQIVFENSRGKQTAAIADVSDSLAPEIMLSAAIFWLDKVQNRRKNPIESIWILTAKKQAKDLRKLHALLRENWKAKIRLFEISRIEPTKAEGENLREIRALSIKDLWRVKPMKIQTIENAELSETASKIIELAPAEIDVVRQNNGETARFFGLPFARVRKISGEEKSWFGVETNRQILSEKTFDDFLKLVEELKTYRRFDSPNKRHAFYQLAPEAWLEAILRRNIKLLDRNLILSPLYHQFRAERDRIDLLALRKDGRLVVIELKVAPDRAAALQAADYWRKIEAARRGGSLQKAKIFGETKILDAPALCYLVAPALSFHKDSEFLARTISPNVEIYRFDLNENWRENLKVVGRRDFRAA
jgi:hypothetical protein